MKITDVESFTIEVPAEADAVEAGVIHQVGVTRIRTDGGLVGYGWGMTPQEQIEDGIKPLLLGQPAYQVEQFLAAAPDFVNWPYVEHALWDLVGKVAEQPIHRLWGAHKSKLRGVHHVRLARPQTGPLRHLHRRAGTSRRALLRHGLQGDQGARMAAFDSDRRGAVP